MFLVFQKGPLIPIFVFRKFIYLFFLSILLEFLLSPTPSLSLSLSLSCSPFLFFSLSLSLSPSPSLSHRPYLEHVSPHASCIPWSLTSFQSLRIHSFPIFFVFVKGLQNHAFVFKKHQVLNSQSVLKIK